MRRTRTELAAALSLLTLTLIAPELSAQDDARARAEARVHFDQGVALSKARDYAAALHEFELAYAAVPHYGVLYNIGQAQVALGRSTDAAKSLRAYLDQGGSAIEAARRAEVEATLARISVSVPSASVPLASAPEAPSPAEPVSAPAPAASVSGAALTPTSPPPATAPRSPSGVENSMKPSGYVRVFPEPASAAPSERGTSTSRAVAYVLGGASLGIGGAALGHYFWNRGRYRAWQADHGEYQRAPSEARRRELNGASESIASASIVTVALTVGASVALGTSAVLFVSSGSSSPAPGIDVTTSTLGVRGSF